MDFGCFEKPLFPVQNLPQELARYVSSRGQIVLPLYLKDCQDVLLFTSSKRLTDVKLHLLLVGLFLALGMENLLTVEQFLLFPLALLSVVSVALPIDCGLAEWAGVLLRQPLPEAVCVKGVSTVYYCDLLIGLKGFLTHWAETVLQGFQLVLC